MARSANVVAFVVDMKSYGPGARKRFAQGKTTMLTTSNIFLSWSHLYFVFESDVHQASNIACISLELTLLENMSLNYDTNVWYQVNVTEYPGYSFAGNTLTDHDGTTGGAVLVTTDTTDDAQSWQFYPYNSSTYLLRSKASGHDSYLAVTVEGGGSTDPAKNTPGDTVPEMAWYNITDASMLWEVTPWGDGTYYLSNMANGSSWRLNALDDQRHLVLDSNVTSAQAGEHFTFSSLSTIGSSLYSTYNVSLTSSYDTFLDCPTDSPQLYPAATASASGSSSLTVTSSATITSGSATATATSATSSASSGSVSTSSGLSNSVSIAIGVSVGVGACAIIAALLFFIRRRRQEKARVYQKNLQMGNAAHDMAYSGISKELPATTHHGAELNGNDSRAELPAFSRAELYGGHVHTTELSAEDRSQELDGHTSNASSYRT